MFSSNSFSFRFHIEVFNPFGVDFCASERQGPNFISLQVEIQFHQHHLLKMLFPPVCVLGTFVKYHVIEILSTHVWVFNYVPLIYVSIFVPVSCCFYDCRSVNGQSVENKSLQSMGPWTGLLY